MLALSLVKVLSRVGCIDVLTANEICVHLSRLFPRAATAHRGLGVVLR